MKKLYAILILAVLCFSLPAAAAPEWKDVIAPPGVNYYYETASKTWKAQTGSSGAVDSNLTVGGSSVGSSTPIPAYDARGRVNTPTNYSATLSTSTPTLLSAIASWTLPCSLQIQANNVAFYNIATTTAATVWAGQRMGQYDTLWITPGSTTYSLSFIASSSAAAVLSVLVHPLVP
jgi:hypothetical protein